MDARTTPSAGATSDPRERPQEGEPTTELEHAPSTRPDLHDGPTRQRVEATLAGVPGVLGARLVPGYERHVDELHVLTSLARQPKQTVRDVQTVLMARFGVSIDHRVISVVQLEESDAFRDRPRVEIAEVGLRRTGNSVVAEVALRHADEVLRTSREAAATRSGRHRAVAQATVSGVAGFLPDGPAIELEGIELLTVGGTTMAVVVLQLHDRRDVQLLSGTAIVLDTPQDAVARAVLDTLNRRVSAHLSR